jgi:hypothetical protein
MPRSTQVDASALAAMVHQLQHRCWKAEATYLKAMPASLRHQVNLAFAESSFRPAREPQILQ